jgi:hypothetical protein
MHTWLLYLVARIHYGGQYASWLAQSAWLYATTYTGAYGSTALSMAQIVANFFLLTTIHYHATKLRKGTNAND